MLTLRYPRFVWSLGCIVFWGFAVLAYGRISEADYTDVGPEISVPGWTEVTVVGFEQLVSPVVEAADNAPFSLRIGEAEYPAQAAEVIFGTEPHYSLTMPLPNELVVVESTARATVSLRVFDGEQLVQRLRTRDVNTAFMSPYGKFVVFVIGSGIIYMLMMYAGDPSRQSQL